MVLARDVKRLGYCRSGNDGSSVPSEIQVLEANPTLKRNAKNRRPRLKDQRRLRSCTGPGRERRMLVLPLLSM